MAHRSAVELDYGMVEGEVQLECREALLFYVLQHLRVDREDGLAPEARQIVVKNVAEVARYSAGAMGTPVA